MYEKEKGYYTKDIMKEHKDKTLFFAMGMAFLFVSFLDAHLFKQAIEYN